MAREDQKPAKRLQLPLLLIGIGLGLLLVVGFAFLQQNRARPASQVPSTPAPVEEQTYPEIPRVSLADAREAYDQGSAVFIDVRSPQSYAASHIKGALSIPADKLGEYLAELDQKAWIIPYCT